MKVNVSDNGQVVTATLSGRLDTAASGEVAQALQPLVDHADKTLVLDCKDLSYISSSGLRIFLTLRKAAQDKGGHVIVRGVGDEIRQVFVMTGFLSLFDIQD